MLTLTQYEIVHDRDRCKQCKGCQILMPKKFVCGKDGKSLCVDATLSSRELKKLIEVAEVCCGNCIQYKDLSSGEVSEIKGHSRVW